MLLLFFLYSSFFFLYITQEINAEPTALQSSTTETGTDYEFFLSVILTELDEQDTILEFMQHYIEEGIDHVFIFDDGSTDETMHRLKRCVDSKYYTIYTVDDLIRFRGDEQLPINVTHQHLAYEWLSFDVVRTRTKWLIKVDADEFITNRADPTKSVRDVVYEYDQNTNCAVLLSPWLLFSWGDRQKDPANSMRQTLLYRWGFHHELNEEDHRYRRLQDKTSIGIDSDAAVDRPSHLTRLKAGRPMWKSRKFRSRTRGIENKVIMRTRDVSRAGSTTHSNILHTAAFRSHSHGALVCIPIETPRMQCAVATDPFGTGSEFQGVVQVLTERVENPLLFRKYNDIQTEIGRNNGYFYDNHGRRANSPPWCPPTNQYLAVASPIITFIMEQDIPHMQLMTFHYRIKSQEDWERKIQANRFNAYEYEGHEMDANRLDVYDDFMKKNRTVAKKNHPDYLKAKKMFADCPKSYYSE